MQAGGISEADWKSSGFSSILISAQLYSVSASRWSHKGVHISDQYAHVMVTWQGVLLTQSFLQAVSDYNVSIYCSVLFHLKFLFRTPGNLSPYLTSP